MFRVTLEYHLFQVYIVPESRVYLGAPVYLVTLGCIALDDQACRESLVYHLFLEYIDRECLVFRVVRACLEILECLANQGNIHQASLVLQMSLVFRLFQEYIDLGSRVFLGVLEFLVFLEIQDNIGRDGLVFQEHLGFHQCLEYIVRVVLDNVRDNVLLVRVFVVGSDEFELGQ